MKNARFYFKELDDNSDIKEHDGIPIWTSNDMIWFAEKYHKYRIAVNGDKSKNETALNLHNVSQQRELLLAFMDWIHSPDCNRANSTFAETVDKYLANNCA